MEAVGLALYVAQSLNTALQNPQLKHVFSIFGYESQLEKLRKTMGRVDAVLRDAERKGDLSDQDKDLVVKLKEVVYDADDLFDKFITLTEKEQLRLLNKPNKVPKKVRRLISRFGKLGIIYNMVREATKIGENLEEISSDASRFNIQVDNRLITRRREETCSYVYQEDIIGREDDVQNVIDFLLAADDDSVQGNISVISIVGMGGLGKTALAQLVFQRIKEFPLKLWACVADEDKKFDVESILGKILTSISGETIMDSLGIERLQTKVRENLDGKKYLLILDDVWTENRLEWIELEKFLKGSGLVGSRIVVTTRSTETAKIVGNRAPYMLKGLSEEASWCLFKMVALGQAQEHLIPSEFAEIGRDIVKKCSNVPLAIKVVGSLLFGQAKEKWLGIKDKDLSSIGGDKNNIKPILKFSYHHLDSPLKNCFTYCALFPKDTPMKKKILMRLWMAQGYLEPLNADQSMENVGEEYFSILLRRCFFQDVRRDVAGEIFLCKMHDLMHDLAHEIAGKEICIAGLVTSETRHAYHMSTEQKDIFFAQSRIRSYICMIVELPLSKLFANWKFLRSMDLSALDIKVLPGGIGELLHLRYLNLSLNRDLELLPMSITKLQNLQTLNMSFCDRLKELPHDLNKLNKLRVLEITDCCGLTFMPSGMEKLTCLRQLTMFVLGGRNSSLKQQQQVGDIQDLQALGNLKGTLDILIMKDYTYVKRNDEGGYLGNKEHLTDISIAWAANPAKTEGRLEGEAEEFLNALQPHRNIIVLGIRNYPGSRMVGWARDNHLISGYPNLVGFVLISSPVLEIASMNKLRFLTAITLGELYKLEYVENNSASMRRTTSSEREATTTVGLTSTAVEPESSIFFPFLEDISIFNMPKLKGWWRSDRGSAVRDDSDIMPFLKQLPSFPRLDTLLLTNCPNLICMPLCHTVKTMYLINTNENLRILARDGEACEPMCSASSSAHGQPSSEQNSGNVISPKLRNLTINDAGSLKCLPRWAISCLETLIIRRDPSLILSGLFGEVSAGYPNSIRSLVIKLCPNLKSVAGVLIHLTGLNNLELEDLPNLIFEDVDEDEGMPWKFVANTLETLKLCNLPKVMKLPKGIRQLTSLKKLQIVQCGAELQERCQCPDGLDWPIIEHVSKIITTPEPQLVSILENIEGMEEEVARNS